MQQPRLPAPADTDAELKKLRKINRVLMDRVERDVDAQGGNAYSLFRTAITLETKVSERTAELTRLTHQLLHEVGERRQAEKALLAAKAEAEQANLGKTRFLAAASHDLHQPLNAARLFLGALADEVSTERGHDLLGRVDAALDTVDDLLSALLDISRLDAGAWPVTLADFCLGTLLARLVEEYAPQAAAVGIALRAVPSRAVIRTDRHLFERLVRNLISNAIRYTEAGRVLIGCRHRSGRVRLEVWDTGIGIPADRRSQIFVEFQRLGNAPRNDGKGLGLGLAIVDRIARLLELTLTVTSELGRGSCFAVAVPRGVAPAEEPEAASPPPLPDSLAKRRIVVIEDDPDALAAMQALLAGWGCTTLAATSVAEALPRLPEVPDLVIADYHLAEASGIAAVATLRQRFGENLPALLVSSDRSPDTRTLMKAHGLPFLAKPVSPARLRAMLSYLLRPAGMAPCSAPGPR